MTSTIPRLELLAAGLLQPSDVVATWLDGSLATNALNVQQYPDEVVWLTVTAADESGDDVRVTFDDGKPVTLGADDDVVARATFPPFPR